MGKKSTLTAEQRTQLVLRLLSKEEPAAQIARRAGISEQTLYRWRLESGGFEKIATVKPSAKMMSLLYQRRVDFCAELTSLPCRFQTWFDAIEGRPLRYAEPGPLSCLWAIRKRSVALDMRSYPRHISW